MVDIIIPTYKPDGGLERLIDCLKKQSVAPNKIILINTEESFWNSELIPNDKDIIIYHIKKDEFDHGKTRNLGVSMSDADIFIMMTQDAMPANEFFIERLVKPLEDEKVASSYARQLVREDSSIMEKISREFNYPDKSRIKGLEDINELGIKAFFCSNVSCAYKRRVFDELGGFVNHTIFNEDMIYANKMIKAGYRISYTSDAMVYHSHNYSAMDQFHRNVDLGVSQADHPEVFMGISSESEGSRMIKATINRLKEEGQGRKIIPYIYVSGWKYLGYLVGKNYKKLPKGFVRRCSMSPGYFN